MQQVGVVAQLGGGARVLDLATLDHVRRGGQRERHVGELLDQQHAGAAVGDALDHRHQALDDDRRQPERELVDHHHLRLRRQRLCQHDHLLLAARQRPGGGVEPALELGEQLERVGDAGLGVVRPPGCRWRP